MKKISVLLAVVLVLALSVCAQAQPVRIGVVSDVEGAIANARTMAAALGKQSPDMILVAGDCYENEARRKAPAFPDSGDNISEMVAGLAPFAELGVPMFVIPGNHETQGDYNAAMNILTQRYPNVRNFHMQTMETDELVLVGMGGYHDFKRMPEDGFRIGKEQYAWLSGVLGELSGKGKPVIFFTHGPPKTDTRADLVVNVGHVGDAELARRINGIPGLVVLHGHIHEGGGASARVGLALDFNAASVTPYMNPHGNRGAVVEVDGFTVNLERYSFGK